MKPCIKVKTTAAGRNGQFIGWISVFRIRKNDIFSLVRSHDGEVAVFPTEELARSIGYEAAFSEATKALAAA